MKVSLGTIEVNDRVRRFIRSEAGKPGLATRDEVRRWYIGNADADLEVGMSTAEQYEREQAELTLWGTPKGSTDPLDEQPLTCTTDPSRIEAVKALAARDGWHSFRIQRMDGSRPDFVGAIQGARRGMKDTAQAQ